MSDILANLNEEQIKAVTETEGFIRVIAGAGTGKTRALSHRFAYLVNELGILPGNILCVTFTNKSSNEMRKRIHSLTGDKDTGYINTFHGFCVSILQEDSYAVQYPKSFLVLDNSDIDAMLKIIYEERNLTLRDMTFSKARDMFEIRKTITETNYYLDMINMSLDGLKEKYDRATEIKDILFYGYLYQQKKCFGLDYNDLINFSLYIFEKNEEIKLKWQKRLEYIMIDEFQDIDALQYKLMCVLCQYHKNLFVVGDPDQTIYSWRGAEIRYLLDFDKNFEDVKTVMMMKNYRSTPQIIAAANSLIEKNKNRIEKQLLPMLPDGKKVICHYAENPETEAQWIAEEIQKLTEDGVKYKDITVLYRAHYLTRTVEEVFLKEKIPYVIYSGIQFFDRIEIKDTLSYLRMIAYKDDLSFMRIANSPKRNIGERRMRFLREYAEKEKCSLYEALKRNIDDEIFNRTKADEFIKLIESFSANYENRQISELLSDILDKSGYEKMLRTEGSQERLDNLAELKQSVYEYETTCGEESTLESYLSHIALFSNSDAENSGDKVKFMTVHTSKGLEFSNVFLCGMNEDIFPSKKTKTIKAMEEERRLAFVAITRAKNNLYLSESEGINFDGSVRYPSRFLLDIDEDILSFTKKPNKELISDAAEHIKFKDKIIHENENQTLFKIGQKVFHNIFGKGDIIDIDDGKSAYIIKFDNINTPRTITFKAHLEEIQ